METMKSIIHPEGYAILLTLGIILVGVTAAGFVWLPQSVGSIIILASGIVFGLVAQFFRNPTRHIPNQKNAIIAPADGTIVAIEPVYESEYFDANRLKLSIYMSALNVHLNRVPMDSEVVYHCYHPGQYLVAYHPKASELNERNTVVLRRADGVEILVRQIAGMIARRIRYYLQAGQRVDVGEELGFIKFGSRCDVFLPLDARVCVQLRQTVKGGETILAEIDHA